MIQKTNGINGSSGFNNSINNLHSYPGYGVDFESLLREKLTEEKTLVKSEGLKFSKHAQKRVEQRGIELTENLMQSLNEAVDKARQKGVNDMVVIGEKGAFVVNVANNVVVTTMTQSEMKENVFTNIDGAILI